jgi:hypothetical protein
MNAQLTDYFMAQQVNRTELDQKAHQSWLAQEAASHINAQAGGNNVVRQLSRRCGRLIQQVIGGMSEPARTADEAIVPYR